MPWGKVRRSFKERDIVLFRECVDLDTVLARGVDSLLSTMPEPEEGWANTFAQGLVKLMKPTLIAEARKGIESWIEKGQVPEPSAEGKEGGVADQEARIGQIGELQFKGMGDKRKEGKTAFITLNLHHVKYDRDFGVEIMMRETPQGHLQIAEIANLAEVVAELDAEEAKWKAGQNRPVREKIDAAVQVVKLDKSTRQDRWGIDRKIVFKATVKNASAQPIPGSRPTSRPTP
jgi:hypothetical protein